jgi:hypothetical protein
MFRVKVTYNDSAFSDSLTAKEPQPMFTSLKIYLILHNLLRYLRKNVTA